MQIQRTSMLSVTRQQVALIVNTSIVNFTRRNVPGQGMCFVLRVYVCNARYDKTQTINHKSKRTINMYIRIQKNIYWYMYIKYTWYVHGPINLYIHTYKHIYTYIIYTYELVICVPRPVIDCILVYVAGSWCCIY